MDFLNPKIGRPNYVSEQSQTVRDPGVSARSSVSVFNRVINYCLLALVFLVPIFFLPLTSEAREFNKQSLLILAVLVMLVAWVIKVLTTRAVSWVKTTLDYVLVGYGLVYLLASYFSIDRASSFLGYWGRFTGSAISVLALILMYFLVVNNLRSRKVTQRLIDVFMASSAVVTIYSLLQLFGWYVLPSFTQSRSFNTVGSMVALSIFGVCSILIYQWQLWAHPYASVLRKTITSVLIVLSLTMMFMINAFIGWLVLALGMIVFMALGMVISNHEQNNQNQNWFWKPMLVLVVAILFVAFQILPSSLNPRNMVSANLPIEIQLSNSATFNLVKNSMSGGIKTASLGSGPGTTGIAFGEIKPADLNKTVVWSLNFDRASNELANIMIETGILGLIAFEAVSILFLLYGLFFLLRQVNHPGRMQAFAFFVLWAALYITHFFYFFNTTFYFLYWLSIAVFMAIVHSAGQEQSEDANYNFSQTPRAALSWMFASLLMLALILVGAFFEASVYVAEASYTNGVNILNQTDPNFEKAENNFTRAVNLNPYRDVYHLANAQNLIFLASIEAAKKDPNIQNINDWIANSVNEGKAATQVSPGKASNWSALAQIYNAIRPLGVQGTATAAASAWNEAIKHDSKNPALYVQLAAAYVDASSIIDPSIAGDITKDADHDGLADDMEAKLGSDPNNSDTNGNSFTDGDEVKAGFNPAGAGRLSASVLGQFTKVDNALLKQAEDVLDKAISLKADLPDPYIAKARVFEKEKNLNDAKKVLDDAAAKFPFNANILFEQGRITYNNGDQAGAEKIFNNVLKLQPKHADALFSLGLIYEPKDKAKALTYYKQVREITGPNVDLDTRINTLENPPATPEPKK
jgi:cytochrome c-type biogenesis protein CcmH/NrfG